MKALKCLGCLAIVIVPDSSDGVCGKCHIILQEDKNLNQNDNLLREIKQIKEGVSTREELVAT